MKKLSISIIGVALLAFVGQASAASVKVKGNGTDSYNRVSIMMSKMNSIRQSNYTKNSNNIVVDVNTGGNEVEDNTGKNSDNKVKTGDVHTEVGVSNVGAANEIEEANPCGCEDEPVDVVVKNNGSDSTNKVEYTNKFKSSISQHTSTMNFNTLGVFANTGDNEVEDNTGGSNSVKSGNVDTFILIENIGLGNTL